MGFWDDGRRRDLSPTVEENGHADLERMGLLDCRKGTGRSADGLAAAGLVSADRADEYPPISVGWHRWSMVLKVLALFMDMRA